MPEAKHTPGPWFLFGNPAHCVGGPHPQNDTAGVAMCGMRLRTPEEGEANARLIAAAPDLLAACEEFEAYHQHGSLDQFPALCSQIRAAIAKAKGGA
jgi:hypothetical protein